MCHDYCQSLIRSQDKWRSLRAAFAEKLTEMGYKLTKADPDVWIWESVKPNGFRYYEILLVYVDTILCTSHQLEQTMDQIKELYHLKDKSIGPLSQYLGANVGPNPNPDITRCFVHSLHSQGCSWFTSHDQPAYHTAATAQNTIGFFLTLMGCLSAHWETLQSQYWSNKQCTHSAHHWANSFCLQLLHLMHSTWTSRNHLLQERVVQAQRSSANATICQEFKQGLQHLLPADHFYVSQSSPTIGFSLESTLALPLADQQLWIHSVQAARSRGSQITSSELTQMQSFFHRWLHPESTNVHTS